MTKKPQTSKPVIPEIKMCPRCGNKILLGDEVCSQCGYRLNEPIMSQFRKQPPNVVALIGFATGILLALAATGMDNPWQFFTLLLGFAFIIGGGLYYGAHILLTSDDRRDKKK